MNILVHSKSLEVTDGIRQYILRQVRKVGKFSTKIRGVSVFMETVKTSQGLDQEAQVKVQVIVPGKKNVVVSSKANDLYLAISRAMEDAAASVRKRKEKWVEKQHHRDKRERIRLALQ